MDRVVVKAGVLRGPGHWRADGCRAGLGRFVVLVGALLMVSACTPESAPPASVPSAPVSDAPATPSASPTPSDDELRKQAQSAYAAAFQEFERLTRSGGAAEPSSKMLDVEKDLYLAQDMAFLRDQKATGYKVEGKASSTKSRPANGLSKNASDERLTLQICEDRRGSTAVFPDGKRDNNVLWQGHVYANVVGAKVMLVDVDTKVVDRCDW